MDLIVIVLIVGAINGIAISFVLLTLKNANPLATRIFGSVVLLFSLLIVEELAGYLQFTRIYPHIIGLGDGLILIIGPLLFLYALVITDRKKRLQLIDLLHLAPFALITPMIPNKITATNTESVDIFFNEKKDKVVSRCDCSGRNNGLFGFEPYNKFILFTIITIWTIRDNKISEC